MVTWTPWTRLFGGLVLGLTVVSCSARTHLCVANSPKVSIEERRPTPLAIYDQLLEKHRNALEKLRAPGRCHSDMPTPAMRERRCYLTEARLWTLTYPQEAEGVAFPLARDEASNPDDRDLAIAIVGVLAGAGNRSAEALLIKICSSPHPEAAATAMQALYQRDPLGRHRDLYQRKARELVLGAIEALGDWSDPESRAILEAIVARDSRSAAGYLASRSLKRLQRLDQPDWTLMALSILGATSGMEVHEVEWALRIAVRQPIPGVMVILRKRLQDAEAEHAKFCQEAWDTGREGGINAVTEKDLKSSFLIITLDWNFDNVLKAFAEMGGELTETERHRLHFLGYDSDSRKRLFKLVADWK
jgi:hypothetical protein